jgi:hypothetical protein
MSLYTLVYISIASKEMPEEELLGILEIARKHNASKDLTGLLLYRDGFFIQALEGSEKEIDALYERIEKDSRHHTVLQIYKKAISQRGFGDWAMGFATPNIETLKDLPGFSDFMQHKRFGSLQAVSKQVSDHIEFLLESFRH